VIRLRWIKGGDHTQETPFRSSQRGAILPPLSGGENTANSLKNSVFDVLEGSALPGEPVFDAVHEGFYAKILEFTGIEEGTVTGGAGLKLNVGLRDIVHGRHAYVARRTVDFPFLIHFGTVLDIAGVDIGCALVFCQLLSLKCIKPQASAALALVVFHSFILIELHLIVAFRAFHRVSFWVPDVVVDRLTISFYIVYFHDVESNDRKPL
jgi:hypothetical protein